jgi:uncharacterized protein
MSCQRFHLSLALTMKNAVFGGNNARIYNYTLAQKAALETDQFVAIKAHYEQVGEGRTNRAYGNIAG